MLDNLDIFKNSPTEDICISVPSAFGYWFALAWWESNQEEWAPDLVQVIDECISEFDDLQNYEVRKLQRIRSDMQPKN